MSASTPSYTPPPWSGRRRALVLLVPVVVVIALVGRSWKQAIHTEEAAIAELVDAGYCVTVDPSYGRALRAPYPPRWFCRLLGRANFRNAIDVSSRQPDGRQAQAYRPEATEGVFFSESARRPSTADLRVIGRLPRLQRLWIENLQTDSVEPAVASALERLKYCRQLQELTIRHTAVQGPRGLPFLRHWMRLARLDLAGSQIDNQGLADIIEHCPHLEQLNLSQTQIDDRGLRRIGRLHKLTQLDLSHTNVGDQGVAHLRNRNLRKLNLAGTHVTTPALQSLRGHTTRDVISPL